MAQLLAEAWPALAPRLAAAERLLVGLDFDGTLSPLAPSPILAEMPAETRLLLTELKLKPGMAVAVVSGRAIDDLRRKVALEGLYLVGNHGLEGEGPGWTYLHPEADLGRDAVRDLDAELRFALGYLAGVFIENKRWSLSVHYRQAEPADVPLVQETVSRLAAARPELHCRLGHEVVEVRPRVDAGKGAILAELAELANAPPEHLLFAGDDSTDEDAFAMWPQSVTIKVGPPSVPTAARFRVPDPPAVADLLRALLELRCP